MICPACGRDVPTNLDGKLRKHKLPMPTDKRLPWRDWCPNQTPQRRFAR